MIPEALQLSKCVPSEGSGLLASYEKQERLCLLRHPVASASLGPAMLRRVIAFIRG